MSRGQREKSNPVTSVHYCLVFRSVGKDLLVIRFERHDVRDQLDLVTMTTKHVRQMARHVVIEEKPHAAVFSVCGSASDSISERWSFVVGQTLINLGPAQIGKTRLYLLEVGTEQEVGNDVMDADPRALDASMTAANTRLGDDVSVSCGENGFS